MSLAKDSSNRFVIPSLSRDQFRLPFFAPAELILRQFFDFASLAQNDVLPAAVLPLKKAQDDRFLFVRLSA
jgi:hypothetical protein